LSLVLIQKYPQIPVRQEIACGLPFPAAPHGSCTGGFLQGAAINGDPRMKKNPAPVLFTALCLFACSVVLSPFVTAADCAHPQNPHAEFTMRYANSTDAGHRVVIFTDRSEAPEDQPIVWWRWYFGDGYISGDKNPVHTYRDHDRYTVRLVVQTACGETYSNEYRDEQTQELDTYCPRPVASFTGNVFEGQAPLTVHFTDTSQNARTEVTAWTYVYGDSHSSSDQNPVYTFRTPGVYSIRQTVKKNCNPEGDESTLQVRVNPAVLGMVFVLNASNTTTAAMTTILPAEPTITTAAALTTSRVPVSPVAVAAQSVAAIAGAGTLSVTTDPAGARVYLDDVLRGASPMTLPNLPAGAHTLRIEREGYQTMRVPVTISDGKTMEYSTALLPESPGGKRAAMPGAAAAVIACAVSAAYLHAKKKKVP
jgi:PKD repeat protein